MLIFAHRGASAIEPENTLLAIQSAIDMNADGIEIDIFEVDNRLVVIHDRRLERTTSGSGLIFQQSFESIRQLDAGKGQRVPTLDEVLAIIPEHCLLNIELKAVNTVALVLESIDKAIASCGIKAKQLLISSFNHLQLQQISQQRPDLAIGALTASIPLGYAEFASQLNAYSVNMSIYAVTKPFIEDAHQRGLKVFVYTVDELEDIKMLSTLAVDGIFANNPKKAKQYLSKISSS
jgi:glycerophosphoryl diester phosphodiesterase